MTWWRKARPPRVPEQLSDPRRLTDGVDPADCICAKDAAGTWVVIDPKCPVHNMTLQEGPA